MAFVKNLMVYRLNIVNGTPKSYFLTWNDVLWRIFGVNIRSRVKAVHFIRTQKWRNYSNIKSTHLGSRNPWTDRYEILPVGCSLWRDHACQFWWRSVKGFWCGEGSNFKACANGHSRVYCVRELTNHGRRSYRVVRLGHRPTPVGLSVNNATKKKYKWQTFRTPKDTVALVLRVTGSSWGRLHFEYLKVSLYLTITWFC